MLENNSGSEDFKKGKSLRGVEWRAKYQEK